MSAVLTVSLSGTTGQPVTVSYATEDGTATGGSGANGGTNCSVGQDYFTRSAALTFNVGETSKTLTVRVCGDTLNEDNENLLVNLSNEAHALVGDGQGQITILDDDAPPTLTAEDTSVDEGNSGTVGAVFTVSLSAASGKTVTVNYATANGTATAVSDYVAASGTLTFAALATSQTVTVTVNGDISDEVDETFSLNLSGASGASIFDGQGIATITDDDAAPNLLVSNATVTEGNSGTANAVFTVSVSAASGKTVTVDWATADGTAIRAGCCTSDGSTLQFTSRAEFLQDDHHPSQR